MINVPPPICTLHGNLPELKLYPYQNEGVDFLLSRKCALLNFEMGLGKTATAIRALEKVREKGLPSVVVFCPAIARRNWENEFKKWLYDLSSYLRITVAETSHDIQKWEGFGVLITSYSLCEEVEAQMVKNKKPLNVLILDESHFLKSPTSLRAKVVLGKIAHRANRHIWALSGTPMPNHAGELWTMLYTFGVTSLTYPKFVQNFCNVKGGYVTPSGYETQIIYGTKMSSIPELSSMLNLIMLQKTLKDTGLELPPLRFGEIFCEKPPTIQLQESGIDALKLSEEERLAESIKDTDTLLLTAQSVSTLRRFTGLCKVPSIVSLVEEELKNHAYEKIVIFGIHNEPLRRIYESLSAFGSALITGATSNRDRAEIINTFNAFPKLRVLVANIQTAGTAINLTSSNQVLFAELSWVPGENVQALKRCHRIGSTQHESIYCRYATLPSSVDRRVTDVLSRKIKEISLTMGHAKT